MAPMTEVLTSAAELDRIAPEWDRLAADDPQATPFQSGSITLGLWRTFAPEVEPRVAVARDASGRLTGVLPMGLHRRRIGLLPMRILGPLATWHGSYFDAVMASPDAAGRLAALLDALINHSSGCDAVAIPHLRDDAHLASWIRAAQLPLDQEDLRIEIPVTREGAKAPGRRGQEIRRTWRRLKEHLPDTEHRVLATAGDMHTWGPRFMALHVNRWNPTESPSPFASRHTAAAFVDWTATAATHQSLRLHIMRSGNRLLAGIYTLHWRDTTFVWRMATDRSLPSFGIGVQLCDRIFKLAGAAGDVRCDMGRGDIHYKHAWPCAESRLWRSRQPGPGARWQVARQLGRLVHREWTGDWLAGGVK